jgi:hypothetical protein
MVSIDPGRMNVLFTLESLLTSEDGAGGTDTPVWEEVADFWGELIQGAKGNPLRNTEQVFNYSYQVNTYWMPELNMNLERMRLVSDSGKILYIENVQNVDEKNIYAVIYCGNEK